jgi:DNA-binding transcriptional MerR regulator
MQVFSSGLISHRSLHYWESSGIVKSSRGENDYRYYDDENLLRIKQIIILRKLRLSIPSIQEIFTSKDLSKAVEVFTSHLQDTNREKEQLDALGTILRQVITIIKDRQNINSVYQFLDTNHISESNELKEALQKVFTEPVQEIAIQTPPEPVVNMTAIDLSLEQMTKADVPEVSEVIKQCYRHTAEMDKLFFYFNFENQLNMPDCALYYKIIQAGECVGAIGLASVGKEAMLIRTIAYDDPDNNIYLFELLKQKHPDILCWNIYFPNDNENNADHWQYDFENKKRQFSDDNGFTFYTDARWNRYIKMLKPHDEVYNSSRYRFALLDGSMDDVAFCFFGTERLDWYDGRMVGWRITDCNCENALVYDTFLGNSKFYEGGFENSDFRYNRFHGCTFYKAILKDCAFTDCDLDGMTIDGVNVKEAIDLYRKSKI